MTSMLLGRPEYILFYSILIERNAHQKTICPCNQKKMLCSERVKYGLLNSKEYSIDDLKARKGVLFLLFLLIII